MDKVKGSSAMLIFDANEANEEEYWKWLNGIAAENNIEIADWSADNVDFHAIAFPSTVKRIEHYTCWCEPTYAEVPAGATWLGVWKIMDKLIADSGDTDHRFIESFRVEGDTAKVSLGS